MSFDVAHWENIRSTCGFDLNDMQYQLDGARWAIDIARALNLTWNEMAQSSIVDFGCGTGRVARVLSLMFGDVVGYDPQPKCIEEADIECRPFGKGKTRFTNLSYTHTLPTRKFDYACCIGVIEHLDGEDSYQAWKNIMRLVGGREKSAVVHWRPKYNLLLAEILGIDPESVTSRTVLGVYP